MVFQLDPTFEEGAAGLSFLVTADQDELFPVEMATIRRAIAEGHKVVYILTVVPYADVVDDLPSSVTTKNTRFIDCVSKEVGADLVDAANVTYTDGPNRLDQIQTHLGVIAHTFDQESVFVLMDSIRGILAANTEKDVKQFIRTLTEKAKTFDMRFKLFKPAGQLDDFTDTIDHLFEETIHVSESQSPIFNADDGERSVFIPSSIYQQLDWEPGESLEADLVDDSTLVLTRNDS